MSAWSFRGLSGGQLFDRFDCALRVIRSEGPGTTSFDALERSQSAFRGPRLAKQPDEDIGADPRMVVPEIVRAPPKARNRIGVYPEQVKGRFNECLLDQACFLRGQLFRVRPPGPRHAVMAGGEREHRIIRIHGERHMLDHAVVGREIAQEISEVDVRGRVVNLSEPEPLPQGAFFLAGMLGSQRGEGRAQDLGAGAPVGYPPEIRGRCAKLYSFSSVTSICPVSRRQMCDHDKPMASTMARQISAIQVADETVST